MVAVEGDTVRLVGAELVTVSVVVPVAVPEVAVMVVEPAVKVFTKPELSIFAIWVFELAQVRLGKLLVVLPSSLLPTAVNCCVLPFTTAGLCGSTVMEVSLEFTKKLRQAVNASSTRTAKLSAGKRLRLGMR